MQEKKFISKEQNKIEHGGEISYHALCCVLEVLENYSNGHG